MAKMFCSGIGVAQDYAEAAKWYRKAAQQGDAESENSLGCLLRDGEGVPQDYAEALSWFRKAAGQNFPEAERNLGGMYLSGLGVEKDPAEGMKWIRKAALDEESPEDESGSGD